MSSIMGSTDVTDLPAARGPACSCACQARQPGADMANNIAPAGTMRLGSCMPGWSRPDALTARLASHPPDPPSGVRGFVAAVIPPLDGHAAGDGATC